MDSLVTRNVSIIEAVVTIIILLFAGGIGWGSLAAEQQNTAKQVEQDREVIEQVREQVVEVKEDVASVKAQLKAIDDRTARIEGALNRVLYERARDDK